MLRRTRPDTLKVVLTFLAMAVMLAVAGPASAITIEEINELDCQCITIGDKTFSDFSVSSGDVVITGADVDVTLRQEGDVYFIDFNSGLFSSSDGIVDIALTYSVTASAGLITEIDQSFNLSAVGTGGDIIIGETVFPAGGGQAVAQSTVSFFNLTQDSTDPPGEVTEGDQLLINPPLSSLLITKDLLFDANSGGFVGATIVTQSFHQTAVPAPAALLLLGSGLLGLGLIARRKK
jgi:hypothetical protein